MEEKAKVTDKLNQAELELFEDERQLVHCDSELGMGGELVISKDLTFSIWNLIFNYRHDFNF